MKRDFNMPDMMVMHFNAENVITASGEPKVDGADLAVEALKDNGVEKTDIKRINIGLSF